MSAFYPYALAEAKKLVTDAQPIRIDANGVYPDGHADLTLFPNASIDVRFISPSRAKRDPKLPLGIKQEWKCQFRVMATATGVITSPIDGFDCTDSPIKPRCSVAQVWKKAAAASGKLTGVNAVANVGIRENGATHVMRWFFDIADVFDEQLPDDC